MNTWNTGTKKLFIAFLFCALTVLPLQSVYAAQDEELVLDFPDFSNAKENAVKYIKNTKDAAARGLKTGKEKLETAKETAGSKILSKTGKSTGGSLRKPSRKEQKDALLKAQGKGYYGTLPDVEREFDYIKQSNKKTNLGNKYKDTLIDEMSLKKSPLDDELFLDVILKKGKDSKYTTDVLRIIPVLQKFRDCISQRCDIQKFNANVNLVDLYSRRLEKDYANTENAAEQSYYLIRNISYLAKLQGNLKYEANFYSKYMPLTGTIYSKENIEQKDYELLHELNKTIFELEQLK